MILTITNKKLLQVYLKYLDFLNINYTLDNNKLNIENNIKLEKIIPIQYSINTIIIEQLIYFLQLLKESNFGIIFFNIKDLNFGINTNYENNNNIVSGGNTIRIEDTLMNDYTYYSDINNNENNQPFVIYNNIDNIVELDEITNNFILNDKQTIIKNMKNDYKYIESFINDYKHNDKIYDNILNDKDIYFKESYYSLALLTMLLYIKPKQKKINSLVKHFNDKLNETPIYFFVMRLLNNDSKYRFLFYI